MVFVTGNPLTEYERQRALNIARNERQMAAMGVTAVAKEVNEAILNAKKRKRTNSGDPRPKKPKSDNIIIRRSLRVQGLSPEHESEGKKVMKDDKESSSQDTEKEDKEKEEEKPYIVKIGQSSGYESTFIETLRKVRDCQTQEEESEKKGIWKFESSSNLTSRVEEGHVNNNGIFCDFEKYHLDENHVVKVMKDRIYTIIFLPIVNKSIVVSGDKTGHISFWAIGEEENNTEGVRVLDFAVHENVVGEVLCSPYDGTKLYSCSYDGRLCVLDVEHSIFREVHKSHDTLYTAFRLGSSNISTVYLADHDGSLTILDTRDKNVVKKHEIHTKRIHTVDFHPHKDYLMATSSTDNFVKLWDIRSMETKIRSKSCCKSLIDLKHNKGVTSAYFSPNGKSLASTCYDDYVRVWDNLDEFDSKSRPREEVKKGENVSGPKKIARNNKSEWWLSPFRAMWMRDSCHLLVGGRSKTIDILSTSKENKSFQLMDPLMTAIPARVAVNSLNSIIAGGTSSGRLYVWRGLE